MNNQNICRFHGRLTKSPADCFKRFENGNVNLAISIAVKSQAFTKDGEPYDRTDYPQIVFWGEQAEAVSTFFSKGEPIEVTTKVQTRRYEVGGEKRYVTEFLVVDFQPKVMASAAV
ncbi:MAG: single-stranded DNA-binding protein [Pseudobdellovibrionaceae bacterium]|nr:single-stranded DNA-binding protein [Pseudobdellovibrionaceae bacterium]